MKRIAIISLIVMFLTVQYAYATCSFENIPTIEEAQELTQDQVGEIFIDLLCSIDLESFEEIDVNEIGMDNLGSIEPHQLLICLFLNFLIEFFIGEGIFYPLLLFLAFILALIFDAICL